MTVKVQLLVRAGREVPVVEFGERMRRTVGSRLLECTRSDVKLTVTDIEPPRATVIPFCRKRVALFSLWTDVEPAVLGSAVADAGLEVWGYQVEESVPRAYRRDWRAGEPTPGVGLLTVFNRKPGLDDQTFLDRWHGGHTPLTLELHPVWCYVRNVVCATILDGTPHRDAIVEEHFREPRDLLSAPVFFGGLLAAVPNMMRVWLDVRRFIDLGTLESFLTREVWLRG